MERIESHMSSGKDLNQSPLEKTGQTITTPEGVNLPPAQKKNRPQQSKDDQSILHDNPPHQASLTSECNEEAPGQSSVEHVKDARAQQAKQKNKAEPPKAKQYEPKKQKASQKTSFPLSESRMTFSATWLLHGYDGLPFGMTSVLLAACSFLAIVLMAWSAWPFSPFEDFLSSVQGGHPLEKTALQPVWWSPQLLLSVSVGILLGGRWALVLYGGYLLAGLVGLPLFAKGGGVTYLLQPGMGYLCGLMLSSVVAGWVFHIPQISKKPLSAKAKKLRERAEKVRKLRNKRSKGLFQYVVMDVVRLMDWLRPKSSRELSLMRWVGRTVLMSCACVFVLHSAGVTTLWFQYHLGLLQPAAYGQYVHDLTQEVWQYDVLFVTVAAVGLLILKSLLIPVYHSSGREARGPERAAYSVASSEALNRRRLPLSDRGRKRVMPRKNHTSKSAPEQVTPTI